MGRTPRHGFFWRLRLARTRLRRAFAAWRRITLRARWARWVARYLRGVRRSVRFLLAVARRGRLRP